LAGLGVKWFNLLSSVMHIPNRKFADEHVKLVNVDFACHFVKHRLTFPNSDPPSTPWAKATAGTREETLIPYLSLALAMYSLEMGDVVTPGGYPFMVPVSCERIVH